VGVGSVVVDVVATVAELPPRGGDVWASGMRMVAGGGFHALAAAARQGVPVEYAGAHGTGPFGDLARAALRAEGVAVRLAPRADLDTGVVVVLVDSEGERTFVSGRGAETTLRPADLGDLALGEEDVVLASGYGLDDALAEWVAGLPDAVIVAFDPGPLVRSEPFARARGRLDWISANAWEAAALTGASDPVVAAGRLGGRAGAIVRTGERGCVVAQAGAEPVVVPAVPVAAVDTTGAGDVHTGVFLAALLRGASPVQAARDANAVAAGWVAVGSYGG
jgi:sugar/nucleoside kinase (ribokinase family)